MAKKKRAAQSRSAEPDDCNADILPARSKKSREDDKQDAAPEAADNADNAAAAPQSRRARKVNAKENLLMGVHKFAATTHFDWLGWCKAELKCAHVASAAANHPIISGA